METESFSSQVKNALACVPGKNGCCRKTDDMLKSALAYPADYNKAVECADRFRCEFCASAYLRRCFIEFGTMSDPEKSYHLEISFPDEKLRDKAREVFEKCSFEPKAGKRRDRFILYFKNSEEIADFLGFAGASDAMYKMINLKLRREVSISVNRQNNFITANLKKVVKAKVAYINAIQYLINSGNYDSLPEDLHETARLSIENDTASMSELGRLHLPPISKSGVKHRLDKIVDISNSVKERNEKKS